MAKRILKLTNMEAIVKIDGLPGLTTINLNTDLLLPDETIEGNTAVNIVSMQITGKPGSMISVARNGENLWDMQALSVEKVDFYEFGNIVDTTNNTSNIDVTINGAEGQILLKLRKVDGYKRPAIWN